VALFVGLVFLLEYYVVAACSAFRLGKKNILYCLPGCIMGYEKERTFMTAVSVFFSGKYRIVRIMGN